MADLDFMEFRLAAALTSLEHAGEATVADAVEFRMDRARDPLSQLEAYNYERPIIATNRASWEGGDADESGRIDALERAASDPHVGAVDIELESVERGDADHLRETARRHDTAIIVSAHDFDRTPPRETLCETLETASAWGDVGKVSVMAAGPGDVLDLLHVTHAMTTAGHTVATMSMGAAGRHSRVVAPLYGSRIGYAPLNAADATAPGQFELDRLAGLIDELRG